MEGTKEHFNELYGSSLTDESVDTTHGTRPVYTETRSGSESIDTNFEDNNYDVTVNVMDTDNLQKDNNDGKTKKKRFFEWISIIIAIMTLVVGLIALMPPIIKHFRCETRPYVTLSTFEAGEEQIFSLTKEVPNLQYSVGGKKWKDVETGPIKFGGNKGELLLRGDFDIGTNGATIIFKTDAKVVCSGDIRTLIHYRNYNKVITGAAKFNELFKDCKELTTAPELNVMVLAEGCYEKMFANTSIRKPPILPATDLSNACYSGMFEGCELLEEVPKLPASNLADKCYERMFAGCTTIKIKEGEVIPELPATDMAKQCCFRMFEGCKALTDSPILSAKNLAVGCYDQMFAGCTSLNHVIMLATEKNAIDCMKDWLKGTASNGIFHKNKNATWDNENVVPSNWVIMDYNQGLQNP